MEWLEVGKPIIDACGEGWNASDRLDNDSAVEEAMPALSAGPYVRFPIPSRPVD